MSEAPICDLSLVVLASGTDPKIALFREMLAAWRIELDALGRSYEVLVVDDGTPTTFFEAALESQRAWPAVRIVRFRRTFGESVALDTAVEKARGKYVVTSTWYLQVDPSGLREVVELLDGGMDYIAIRRHPRVDGKVARLISWAFNAFTRRITQVKIHDLNCSFRAFRREVVEELSYHGDLFRFISVLAVRKGFRVREISLRHLREEGPPTFFRPGLMVRRFLDVMSLFFLIKFTRKPLRFFGLVGVIFFMVGMSISTWLLYVRLFQREGIADRPLLILGIFLVVLGIIVSSIGLIGEIIIFTQGRELRDYHIDSIIEGGTEGTRKESS